MPKIVKVVSLEVEPKLFLQNCTDVEIVELWLELSKIKYQSFIRPAIGDMPINNEPEKPIINKQISLPEEIIPENKSITEHHYMDYAHASSFVQQYEIKSITDYNEKRKSNFCYMRDVVPSAPDRYYKEWTSWFDFLGKEKTGPGSKTKKKSDSPKANENIKKTFVSYQKACETVRKLNIASQPDFIKQRKTSYPLQFIPSRPDQYPEYKKDWISWYEFLGKERQKKVRNRTILKDEKSVKVVKTEKNKSSVEVKKFPVRIDAKTIIYVKEGTDPEEAKANYLNKHKD